MYERKYAVYLAEDGKTDNGINSRLSNCRCVENGSERHLDSIVADNVKTFKCLLDLKFSNKNPKRAAALANSVRCYYRMVNKKTYPSLNRVMENNPAAAAYYVSKLLQQNK